MNFDYEFWFWVCWIGWITWGFWVGSLRRTVRDQHEVILELKRELFDLLPK